MKLGIIRDFEANNWDEAIFQSVQQRGLEFIELCINYDRNVEDYIHNNEALLANLQKYNLAIGSVGRWGAERILPEGEINPTVLKDEEKLIRWCREIGCGVYVTGCNEIEGRSFYQNCSSAIQYFSKLLEFGKEYGVKIAVYNCRWNNFVHSDPAWEVIHGHLPELCIKYDCSHTVCAGGDYMSETVKWGKRFAHVHIKGTIVVNGEHVDDPPAGLDMINWPQYMGLLYAVGYNGGLSIEPHSSTWRGELGEKGIDFTVQYFKERIFI